MESNCSWHKGKPWAWQSGWFCAKDGKPHDLVLGPEETIKQYNAGYEAYENFSQVHCQSKKVSSSPHISPA
jgi:hypothetical protein